ncbi:hypothetical protein J2T12_004892 [Paenibacillus anaericanus]|uniref:hypothetical protein n=1 Tax=Paenibacillus anaericanus TaxID=170367 RepID=UPI00278761E1|nr:hypothetical protein [Paenibacillus anaericanus]MDQ0091455.1 hypothetical protein [Paenibacillus anaericanus]
MPKSRCLRRWRQLVDFDRSIPVSTFMRMYWIVQLLIATDLVRMVESSKVDLIVDGTDHFSIRYMINDSV